MIRYLAILGCLITFQSSAEEPIRVRILSYNIHHAEGMDRKTDLERIATIIKSVSPDVVSLQEVDSKTSRVNGVDQPRVLARLTGMEVRFEKNISFGGGEYGNAILTKLPIVRHENVHLPNRDQGEQRGMLAVQLGLRQNARPLLFIATHLDHRRNDLERFESAQVINDYARKQQTSLAILAGDLNATRNTRVLEEFEKEWHIANREELPTVPVGKPVRQIDFVLLRPEKMWKVVEVRVLPEAVASDHRAILAVLELNESRAKSRN